MAYWLMKSEPSVYSIDDLKRDHKTCWEGVHNYQARNYLKSMKKGDQAFFYHSSANPPTIAGVMKIVREAYVDSTQFDKKSHYYDSKSPRENPRWFQVDVAFVKRFSNPLSLETIKGIAPLRDMVLVKRGRLSVQPVIAKEWDFILKLCV